MSLNEIQKAKKKFRNSKVWKSFRHQMNIRDKGRDVITGRKLIKGYELHHLNLKSEDYQNLNEEHFISVNKLTHKFLHWIFIYYRKDKTVIERIVKILDKMVEINS